MLLTGASLSGTRREQPILHLISGVSREVREEVILDVCTSGPR